MPGKTVSQILIVDDEADNRTALSLLLTRAGYRVEQAASGEEALGILEHSPFEVIVTDLFLPGLSGMDILRWAKEHSPYTNVILITGNATAETAVEAMKEGAFDYITKPFNFEKLKIQLAKALEKSRLVAENLYLRQQLQGRFRFDNIIGSSLSMQQVFTRVEKVVNTDTTILVLGESGTGKELVARAIHFNSPRREKPFVAINCSAIPAELLESELFGHVKGSFTGATNDKIGRFEAAEGGTIFLDEIGTMPLQLQTKLLRVLQEHEIERVGSNRKIRLNVRVVSATNADLDDLVAQGQFREDLYYRLNVIPIHLPPLRERRDDIPLLVRHFLQQTCGEQDRPLMSLTDAALAALEGYAWPGNVRELENVIERTVTLTDGERIDRGDLPPKIAATANAAAPGLFPPQLDASGVDLPLLVEQFERRLILEALALSHGVKSRAAALLGLNRTTLVEKIRRNGLESDGPPEKQQTKPDRIPPGENTTEYK
jgi:DNA-binding NtrC family response regulator